MKKIYIIVTVAENGDKKKLYNFVDAIQTGNNLIPIINRYKAECIHLCESRKQADELALYWNDCLKNNGTYAFA